MGLGRRTGWVFLQEGYLLRYNRVAFTVHVIPGLRSYSFLLCLGIALLYPLLFFLGPAILRFLYIILAFTLVFGTYMAGYSFGASFFPFFLGGEEGGGTVERVSFGWLGMAVLSLFPLSSLSLTYRYELQETSKALNVQYSCFVFSR